MSIAYIKEIIYKYKDYSNRWDYSRRGKDLSILKSKKKSFSLIL
jgi:hypothetical protein